MNLRPEQVCCRQFVKSSYQFWAIEFKARVIILQTICQKFLLVWDKWIYGPSEYIAHNLSKFPINFGQVNLRAKGVYYRQFVKISYHWASEYTFWASILHTICQNLLPILDKWILTTDTRLLCIQFLKISNQFWASKFWQYWTGYFVYNLSKFPINFGQVNLDIGEE